MKSPFSWSRSNNLSLAHWLGTWRPVTLTLKAPTNSIYGDTRQNPGYIVGEDVVGGDFVVGDFVGGDVVVGVR